MTNKHKEKEVTFYNWDEHDIYSPSQKQEIRNYLETQKEKSNGKKRSNHRSDLRDEPSGNTKPRG